MGQKLVVSGLEFRAEPALAPPAVFFVKCVEAYE
jgi:hypothetical protein